VLRPDFIDSRCRNNRDSGHITKLTGQHLSQVTVSSEPSTCFNYAFLPTRRYGEGKQFVQDRKEPQWQS
jgi:hypothetical protein